jgi:hypothetical protein
MSVEQICKRPQKVRSVPLLTEPEIGHYPEFREFFHQTFDLDIDPLGKTGLVSVEGRFYEFIFISRSGEPFPSGVEIAALIQGLEPMDSVQADTDLWAIMEWLVEGVGEPWTVEMLRKTGAIYRITAEKIKEDL